MFRVVKDWIRRIRVYLIRALSCNSVELVVPDNVLVIAPHPDDEVLGCSGLIQRLLSEGKRVDVVILSGGGRSHATCCDIDASFLIESRRNLSRTADHMLGLPVENLHFLDYPDGNIVFENSETERLRVLIDRLQPQSIFVPHRGEGWKDHLSAGQIARKLIAGKPDVSCYEYCVWFWYYNVWHIDWKNVSVLKLTRREYELKNQAIDAYICPKAPCGKPWSGVLPPVFVWANRWRKELYFKKE